MARPKAQSHRVSKSFRLTPALSESLDAAAVANGRSVTQEIEIRLEHSERDQRILDSALDMAYGRQTAEILRLLGTSIRDAARIADYEAQWSAASKARRGLAYVHSDDWLTSPTQSLAVASAIDEILVKMRLVPADLAADAGAELTGRSVARGTIIKNASRSLGSIEGEDETDTAVKTYRAREAAAATVIKDLAPPNKRQKQVGKQ
jgi:hypothetical protein